MWVYIDICQVIEIKHGLFRLTLPYKQEENFKIGNHNDWDINLSDFIVEITTLQFGIWTSVVSNN